jgi:RHS repeat-associated protein
MTTAICGRGQQDYLGSTVGYFDKTKNPPGSAHAYYPFGGHRSGSYALPTDKKFTGQRLDDNTGLYYYGARYYDPEIGRFISPDPFVQFANGFDCVSFPITVNFIPLGLGEVFSPQGVYPYCVIAAPINPQALNRYAYVLNNPLRYTDPMGYINWAIVAIGAVVLIACVATGGVLGVTLMAVGGAVEVATCGSLSVMAVGACMGGSLTYVGVTENYPEGSMMDPNHSQSPGPSTPPDISNNDYGGYFDYTGWDHSIVSYYGGAFDYTAWNYSVDYTALGDYSYGYDYGGYFDYTAWGDYSYGYDYGGYFDYTAWNY